MDCGELREGSLQGEAPGPEAQAHAAACPPCAELIADAGVLASALAAATAAPSVAPGFDGLARRLEADRGPRAWLAALPTPARAGLLLAGAALIAAGAGLPALRPDLAVYPDGRMVGVLGLLAGAALVLAGPAVRSLHRAPLSRGQLVALSLLGAVLVPGALAALPSAHAGHQASVVPGGLFAAKALGCFAFGALVAAPLLVWAALLDRGGAPWRDPAWLGLAAGVAALGANAALQLHCPITAPAHRLASHATVGVALLALAGVRAASIRPALPRAGAS